MSLVNIINRKERFLIEQRALWPNLYAVFPSAVEVQFKLHPASLLAHFPSEVKIHAVTKFDGIFPVFSWT